MFYALEVIKLYADILKELSDRQFFVNNNVVSNLFSFCDCEKLIKNAFEISVDFPQCWQLYWKKYTELLTNNSEYTKRDRRFHDPDWNKGVFKAYRDLYEANSYLLMQIAEKIANTLEPKLAKKLLFFIKLIIDTFCPCNIPFTNPIVIKEYFATNGRSIVQGMYNFLHDIRNSNQKLIIKTTDESAFQIGKNIATTAGAVVAENEIMQLIQYKPLRSQTYSIPILIVPPWINRFYILDLNHEHSFVRWLLERNYSVFIISWVNPDSKISEKSFADYIQEGIIFSINQIQKITKQQYVNAIGYCISGTLLCACVAYLCKLKIDYIKSATFLTTLIDFSGVGDLSVFIDENQIQKIESSMKKTGFLDSDELKSTFSILRANEMIWHFFINNYLLGKKCKSFALLHWNEDGVRLPAALHSFYLRNMYLNNHLIKPNGITIMDTPINISQIDIPVYFVATKRDHIVPWKSCFKGFNNISNSKTKKFVLAAAGHVAGVINHPDHNKYCYWINDNNEESADQWLQDANQHNGSWWHHWHEWNVTQSGSLRKAYNIPKKLIIEPAPGRYVAG